MVAEYFVATALTVYGIETLSRRQQILTVRQVATALTVYGIETFIILTIDVLRIEVATALTVYGIETVSRTPGVPATTAGCNSTYRLRY